MNENQIEELKSLIEDLEKQGLSQVEIQSRIDSKKQEFLDAGKPSPTTPGAVVEETAAPIMVSGLAPGDLGYGEALEKQNDAQREMLLDLATPSIGVAGAAKFLPTFVKDKLFNFTVGATDLAVGTVDAIDAYVLPLAKLMQPSGVANLATEIALSNINNEGVGTAINNYMVKNSDNIDLMPVYDDLEKVKNLTAVKKFDDQGNQLDVAALLEKGEYLDAADLAASQAAYGAPTLVASAINPLLGSAIAGASTSGRDFAENRKRNPKATALQLYGSATLKGGLEMGTEYFMGKLMRSMAAGGANKTLIKDATRSFLGRLGVILGNTATGFGAEGVTEALTSLGQDYTDVIINGDEIEAAQIGRNMINSFVIGGFLGGPGGTVASTIGQYKAHKNKENLYQYIAPNQWKIEKTNLQIKLASAREDKDNANSKSVKKAFDNKIKKIENDIKNHDQKLNDSFDYLSRNELIQLGEKMDYNREKFYEVKNGKFSEEHRNEVKKQIEKNFDDINHITAGFFDAGIEQSIFEAMESQRIVNERIKKLKGVNKEDLDIIKVNNETLPEGMGVSEAMFLDEVGKKPTIYINTDMVALTGATNALGHDLMHYTMSRTFKTDNASMRPLVDAFKSYLNESEQGKKVLNRIETRMKSQDVYFDAAKNEFKEGALEEYFNIFADIVSKEKVTLNETKLDGLKRQFKNTIDNIFGKSNIQFNNGKDIVNFIKNYTNNVNNKNKLLKYNITTTIKGVQLANNKDSIVKKSQTEVVPVNERELSELIDQHVNDTMQTNEDFVQKGGLEGADLDIRQLGTLDGYLTNLLIEDGKIPQQQIPSALNKLKDRLLERIEKNYQPIKDGSKRSLFSYIFGSAASKGKGGIAFRSLQDIKAEIAKAPKTVPVQKQTSEGVEEIQISEDAGIENFVDRSLSEDVDTSITSALQNNLTVNGKRILDPEGELAQVIRDTALEIQQELKDLGLDPTNTKYRKEYIKIIKNKSKDALKKFRKALDISTKEKYEKFLREIFNKVINNPKALNISYFVQAERENENKIFAKKNRRLTKQKDIRKAVEDGLAFVENEADGVMLYDKLRTTTAQGLPFFLDGKRIDGKKTALVTALFMQAISDATPGVLDKAGFSDGQKNTVLRKIQRVANQKFSQSNKKYTEYEISQIINSLEFQQVLENHIGIITDSDDITQKIDAFIVGLNVLSRKYPKFNPVDFMKNKSGQTAEYFFAQDLINKVFPGATIENIGELKELVTGDTGVDVILKTPNGQKIGFEVKMNSKAIMGSFTIGNIGITEGLLTPGDQTLALSIAETLLQNNIIPALKKEGFKDSDLIIENGQIRFPKEKNGKDVLNIINKALKQAQLNKTDYILLEDGGNLIAQFYINKGKNKGVDLDYIYMYDVGLMYLNKNTLNIPNTKHISEVIKGTKVAITWKSTDSKSTPKGKSEIYRTLTATVQLNTSGKPKSESIKIENIKKIIKRSQSSPTKLNKEFNDIIELKTGIKSQAEFGDVKGRRRGKKSKGVMSFFVPYGAEDFQGLMYALLPDGKKGDESMEWIRQNFFRPYSIAMENIDSERAAIMADFKALKDKLKSVPKKLKKPIDEKGDFTFQDAVRVWIWNKQGMDIPGLSKADLNQLVEIVNKNSDLKEFASDLIRINKSEGYIKPDAYWDAGTITTDLFENINTNKRQKYLQQWKENIEAVFTESTYNKLEAAFGSKYVKSLKNILKRMKSGRNRTGGGNSQIDNWLDWLNNSVGAIMFLNVRSAVLQTISTVNYMNWSDNNPLKAAKAYANQKQFWSDFSYIFNSNYLVQRRGGTKLNIQENEIAEMAEKGGIKGAISYLLNKGFVLTRMADSFAIATGGAAMYRNRVNTYIKEGLSKKEAQEKAFSDFREITEEAQQSSRPDRISMEQASGLGRVFLAFANTPMQYTRLMKRATQDLIAGRGDAKTNISKLIYYSVIQNFIFNALQQALFALGFDEEEEEEKIKEKYTTTLNGMVDSILRGTGVAGNAVMVGKNFLLDLNKRSKKPRPNFADAAWKLLDVSPPLDSKVTKIRSALYTLDYSGDAILDKGLSLDNPAAMASAQVISATTNVPLDRVMRLYDNVRGAVASDTEAWQRVALLLGWSTWELGMEKDKKSKKKSAGGAQLW
jgi:hypothetical protein|tara:strand:+ start:3781 stop:10194 length:6414 start_codon:yes stop_codon:yes gene_type:complete